MRKVLFVLGFLFISLFPLMANESVGRMKVTAATVEWENVVDCESVVLTVQAADGSIYSETFASGHKPSLDLKDLGRDGAYTYELRVVPRIAASVRGRLAVARDDREAGSIQREAGLTNALVQSGTITITDGAFVVPQVEPAVTSNGAWWRNRPGTDETFLEDVYISGQLCVGLDCTGSEALVFKTILLRENNDIIHFEDTSTSVGFPSNDWRIVANDTFSGGANNFRIEDVTGSKVPFLVEANAPTNSVYLDSSGRVGFRTATPALDLHVNTGNGPGVRLEQNNGSGNPAQTWDVIGTHNNFFVRDVTNGNLSPFRIRPGAPTSSIDVAASGNVGLNCDAPTSDLVIASGAGCSNPSSSINAGATQFTAASSRTFKENITRLDVPDLLERMAKVDVYQYDFVQGPRNRIGLIAEDFHRVFGRGDEKYIDGSEVQMALWLAVKQLAAENKELREKLTEIEKRME